MGAVLEVPNKVSRGLLWKADVLETCWHVVEVVAEDSVAPTLIIDCLHNFFCFLSHPLIQFSELPGFLSFNCNEAFP